MEKSCMIPARYCTIFKPQKTNLSTNEKKVIFFIAHSTSLTIFFFNQRVLSSPSISAKLDTCLPLKLINKEHKMEKKDVLQMLFSKCKHFSQQNWIFRSKKPAIFVKLMCMIGTCMIFFQNRKYYTLLCNPFYWHY